MWYSTSDHKFILLFHCSMFLFWSIFILVHDHLVVSKELINPVEWAYFKRHRSLLYSVVNIISLNSSSFSAFSEESHAVWRCSGLGIWCGHHYVCWKKCMYYFMYKKLNSLCLYMLRCTQYESNFLRCFWMIIFYWSVNFNNTSLYNDYRALHSNKS